MNFTFKIRYQNFLVFSSLILFCSLIYWPSLIALPKADHSFILHERQFYDNDFNFFTNLLSFSRTRHIAPGDVFLFRPGTTGLLAILDIFFRSNLYLLGGLSILWHAIAVFSAYLIFQRIKISVVATCSLIAIVLVQYPGMDMIVWRHISPYIFSLVFFMLGIMALLRAEYRTLIAKDNFLALSMFFTSMLFHELLVFALPLAFVLSIFTPLRKKLGLRFLSIILLLPSASYMIVNVADYLLYESPSVVGPKDYSQFQLKLTDFLSLPGIFLYQFILPFFVEIEDLRSRTTWHFPNVFGAEFLFPCLGFILLSSFFIIFSRLVVSLNNRSVESSQNLNIRCLLVVIILSSLISLLGGLLVGRVALRGLGYMENSTYYFYIFNYLIVLINGLMLSIYRRRIQESKLYALNFSVRKINGAYIIPTITAFFILAELIVMNRAIQGANLKEDMVMAKTTRWASDISKQREYCYAGSEIGVIPDVLLYRESCQVKKGIPLVLLQATYFSYSLVDKLSGNIISTFRLKTSDFDVWISSEMERKLIGMWKGVNGKPSYIFYTSDNSIFAENENGSRDQLIVNGSSIKALTWQVQPNLSDDGKSLNWGNGTSWTR